MSTAIEEQTTTTNDSSLFMFVWKDGFNSEQRNDEFVCLIEVMSCQYHINPKQTYSFVRMIFQLKCTPVASLFTIHIRGAPKTNFR